jgi:hypothetical protein
MELLGNLNDRDIIYIKHDTAEPWFQDFPNKSWLLFVITNAGERNIFNEINRRAIDNNVVYVCTAGPNCELFHDILDENIVIREIEGWYLPDYCIMTTWHNDFDEGFWYAVFAAYGDDQEINKIVCLDITKNEMRLKLVDLVEKIKTGWLPPDT